MPLLQAKQLIWDEIITELKSIRENITLMATQKIVIKDYELFISSTKEEEAKMRRRQANSSNILTKNQPRS